MTKASRNTPRRDAPELRDANILAAAAELARQSGFQNLRRDEVARHARYSAGLVNKAFGTVEEMRDALMRWAVRNGDVRLVAQGLAVSHPAVADAPDDLKRRAAESLA